MRKLLTYGGENMGAWGIGIFEDDAALDILDEINDMDEDIVEFMQQIFDYAMKNSYLDYDESVSIVVCSALIDYKINKTYYEILIEDYEELILLIEQTEIELLSNEAVEALRVVISEKSELSELWKENDDDYPKWRKNMLQLINRLT